MAFLGVDIGSVSVKTVWLSSDGAILHQAYRRHLGRPLELARQMLNEALALPHTLDNMGITGSGGQRLAEQLGVPFENEVMAHARACAQLTPEAKSLIVVGGEDSFFVSLDGNATEAVNIRDFAMNGLCAAGCGGFLDQQASRLGIDIDGAFGTMALESSRPARVAGRCSVFAKTDMIHLQQKATPVCDIVAGLCFAFARNFVNVLARGKEIIPPVVFQGGVTNNAGMIHAFREIMGIAPEEFIVPAHAAVAGAVGAALVAREAGVHAALPNLAILDQMITAPPTSDKTLPPLEYPGPPPGSNVYALPAGEKVEAFLGVDIGSVSTNVVVIDAQKRVLAKSYLMTAGRPIEAVRKGLAEVGEKLAVQLDVKGVCTTGSGRYLIGDFIGADVVKNEITAQARAAAEIDPQVDTIFEIGGQDSKFIRLEDGAIIDFEMNKVCAAGTGSFLEEQAERLGVSIKGEFADLAFTSPAPVRLGERCTVFMESDLVGHQAHGASTADLAAGLAYSVVQNYLQRVVCDRPVGDHVFFQGGTAFNRAVVAAFQQVTGKPITVPEHHEVTGAIGCALMARDYALTGQPTRFKGWDLSQRTYTQESFECKACANRCEINRVLIEGEQPLVYGGRCEKFERKRVVHDDIPDLFAERDTALLAEYVPGKKQLDKPYIGIPRTLHFLEYAPFWMAFFKALDLPVLLSSATNKQIITTGVEATLAEFCFPMKVAHGHALELMDAGVTHLFVPCVMQLPKLNEEYRESVPCPYVSSLPFALRAALQPEEQGVAMMAPVVDLSRDMTRTARNLHQELKALGISRRQITAALETGQKAQQQFNTAMLNRGREVLDNLPPNRQAIIIIGRPYNSCDNGLNLELPSRFRELGALPIPMDMLPVHTINLAGEFPDLTWRYGQKILSAAEIIREDPRLAAVYMTNFGCGPDSFLMKFFRARMAGKVFLTIEVDEHSSDVGALTRCEAFLDSLQKLGPGRGDAPRFTNMSIQRGEKRTVYIPSMSDIAHAIAGAFRSVGVSAEVLPDTDAEAIALGKKYCSGKECFPAIVTTGDMLRQLQRVDPNTAAFFMPTATGGCRFGYYYRLQRMILDELGYENVPIYAPNQNLGLYTDLGAKAGDVFVRRAWEAFIAIEILEKALMHVRPLEVEAGLTDRLYLEFRGRIVAALEKGRDLLPVMRDARTAFGAIPIQQQERPWVGIVGENFVRMHQISNQHLVRSIEALGGRAWLIPFNDWIYYVNLLQQESARARGDWSEYLKVYLTDRLMNRIDHRLAAPWEGFLPHLHQTTPAKTLEYGKRYIDPAFDGEAVVSMGEAIDFHRRGLAGVINVMPFTCMHGTITGGMIKRFQQEHDQMPVLNLAFDGQETNDLPIRLDAFMHQCRAYQRRKGDVSPV